MPLRFDLQSHSTHSDGALAAAEVVQRAAEAGVELLALSDHDTVSGVSEALAAGDWGELEVVICNPTFVVGAYGTGASSAEVVRLVASGLFRAYPPGGTNFVNADDVADGLLLAMERGRPGERYLLGGEEQVVRAGFDGDRQAFGACRTEFL